MNNYQKLFDFFVKRHNLSLMDMELEEIIDKVKTVTDPKSCESCMDRRGIEDCPLTKGERLCITVINNRLI